MNTLSHIQWGWIAGNITPTTRRERAMLMLASVAPDLDGIFIWNAKLFDKWHHTYGHNIFTGLVVGAVAAGFADKGNRVKWFLLGYAMVALHIIVDFVTCPSYELRFFWPISDKKYYILEMMGVSAAAEPTWNFILTVVVQISIMILLAYVTVDIYMKHRRTFFELISPKVDRFITDFIVLPFKGRCEFPGCENRAHYTCGDSGSLRCVKHCKIHRDLSITCPDDGGG